METRYQFHREKKPRGILTRVVQHLEGGGRKRLALGYNLTPEEEVNIAQHRLTGVSVDVVKAVSGDSPMAAMAPLYLQYMQNDERVDTKRGVGILTDHLARLFPQPMKDLTLIDGVNYITARRSETTCRKKKVTSGTIERECGVLMRVMTLAVRHKYIAANPFDGLKVPKCGERDRPLSMEELHAIVDVCVQDVRRAILVGLCTGLREGRICSITADQFTSDTLSLPKSRTAKSHLQTVPLNRTALAALRGTTPVLVGPVFPWRNANAFGKIYRRTVRTAGRKCPSLIADPPTFHDLRHTFATALQDLDADPYLISYLLGHGLKTKLGTSEKYMHAWKRKAAEAVMLLDAHWAPISGMYQNTLSSGNCPQLPTEDSKQDACQL